MPLLTITVVPAPESHSPDGHSNVVTVRLAGECDLSTRAKLVADLYQAAALGSHRVVVDVGRARFWDSSGLTVLSTFRADLAGCGRACRVVDVPPATHRLATLAGLAAALDMDGPLAAAR